MRAHLAAFTLGVALFHQRAGAAPGDLDPSFGASGRVTGPAGGARTVAIPQDGRVVVFADEYPSNGGKQLLLTTRWPHHRHGLRPPGTVCH